MFLNEGLPLLSHIALFIDLPSLLFVGGGSLLFGLTHHSPEALFLAHQAAFTSESLSNEEAQPHLGVLATLRGLYLGIGSLGVLIGFIKMLARLDDPHSVGPAMAVACLPLLYGVILAELWTSSLMNRLITMTQINTLSEEETL
jgi:hypothetical protein